MNRKRPRWKIKIHNGIAFVSDTQSKHPSLPIFNTYGCNLEDSEAFLSCIRWCIDTNVQEKRRRNRDHLRWDLVHPHFLRAARTTKDRIDMKKRWKDRKKRFSEFMRFAFLKKL